MIDKLKLRSATRAAIVGITRHELVPDRIVIWWRTRPTMLQVSDVILACSDIGEFTTIHQAPRDEKDFRAMVTVEINTEHQLWRTVTCEDCD
jgi:hypothetical protein